MFISYLGKQVEYIKIPLNPLRRFWKRLTFQPYKVVYLHGFCDPFQNHIDLMSKIAAKGYEVYALNLPGHMQSEKWEHITWEGLINLVSHFLFELNIRNPIVVGFSLGGGIGLQLASVPNINIHSLKLIAPFCYSLNALSPRWIDNFLHAVIDTVSAMHTNPKQDSISKVSLSYAVTKYKDLFSEYNLSPEQIAIPTSVLLLGNDHILENQQITSTLCRIDGCRFDTLEGQTHDIYYISDERVKEIVNKLF